MKTVGSALLASFVFFLGLICAFASDGRENESACAIGKPSSTQGCNPHAPGDERALGIDPTIFGATCEGVGTAARDTAAFTAAISEARKRGGGTVLVPSARCYLTAALLMPQGVNLVGSGIGSCLIPAKPMNDMIVLGGSLSSIRRIQLADVDNLARNAIAFDAPDDALPAVIEDNLITRFPGAAIHVESGQALQVRSNSFLSNGVAVSSNNDGISLLIEANYSAGGNGFLLQKTGRQGPEGSVIRDNVVFASVKGFALKISAGLDISLTGNMFEGGDAAAIVDASDATISGVRSTENWYGADERQRGKGVALRVAEGVYGFVSSGDIFEGRGNTAVDCSANTSLKANLNPTFMAPLFLKYSPATIDLRVRNTLGLTVVAAQFSGAKSIVEDDAVSGRVDASTFSAVPERRALAYGHQTFGLTLVATGLIKLERGMTSVRFAHHTDFSPLAGEIAVELRNLTSNDTGTPSIDSCDATTCRLSVRQEPGPSGAIFAFRADETQ